MLPITQARVTRRGSVGCGRETCHGILGDFFPARGVVSKSDRYALAAVRDVLLLRDALVSSDKRSGFTLYLLPGYVNDSPDGSGIWVLSHQGRKQSATSKQPNNRRRPKQGPGTYRSDDAPPSGEDGRDPTDARPENTIFPARITCHILGCDLVNEVTRDLMLQARAIVIAKASAGEITESELGP